MCWTPCVRCFGSPTQPSHRLLDSVCTVFRLSYPTTSSCAGLRVYGVPALLLNKSPSAGLRVYGVSALLPNHVIVCWTPCVRCFGSPAQQVTICWTPCVRCFGSPAQPRHHVLDSVCTVFRLCCSTSHHLLDSVCTVFRLSCPTMSSCTGLRVYGVPALLLNKSPSAGLRVYGVSALLPNHAIMCWTPCVRCFGSPAQPCHHVLDSVCTVFRLCCSTNHHLLDSVCTVFRLSCPTMSSCAGLRVYGVSALLPNHVIMCWTPCVRCFGSPAQPRHRLLDSVCTVFRLSCSTMPSCAGLRVYGVSALLLNHVMCWTPCVRCFGCVVLSGNHLPDSVCTVFRLCCSTKSSSAGLRVYGVSVLLPNQVMCWTPCVRCFGSPAQLRCFDSAAQPWSSTEVRVYNLKLPSAEPLVPVVGYNTIHSYTPHFLCFSSKGRYFVRKSRSCLYIYILLILMKAKGPAGPVLIVLRSSFSVAPGRNL